jgi:arylsulfatase A-like enzyme
MPESLEGGRAPATVDRRDLLKGLGAGAFAAAMGGLPFTGCRGRRRPNFVLIFADDLGYGDVSCCGGEVPTPNIDSIAVQGVRFSDGYVTAPVCSPSRAGLLTGRYQERFGHEFNIEGHWWRPQEVEQHGLDLGQITVAQLLRDAGYATGLVGKWHLGMEPAYHPLERGFDEFFGCLSWGYVFNPPGKPWSPPPDGLTEQEGREHFQELLGPIYRGREPVEVDAYFTDALSKEAVSFIERHRREPFFLYLSYTAVHVPLEATSKYLDRFPDLQPESRRTYAAMTSALDDGVGSVLAALRDHGLEEDTLVFFLSDNGALTLVRGPQYARNTPLRGGKLTPYEGGVRIPFLAMWPGRIPAGLVSRQPIVSFDIPLTMLAAAGVAPPADRPLDGVDLMPNLEGRGAGVPHQAICWRYGPNRAVRVGDWKLVQFGGNPVELYDLEHDVGETRNLAGERPETVARLERAYASWEAQMVPPAWTTLRDPIELDWEGKHVVLEI